MTIKVALTNLGKYNEGELVYEWIELPASEDEIDAVMERIGIDGEEYEEYFISDYEAPFHIKEYVSVTHLNEIAEALEELDEYEMYGFEAYIDQYGNRYLGDIEDAIEFATSGEHYVLDGCYDMVDVAYELIEQGYLFEGVDEQVLRYIDYEKLGRELDFESTFVFLDNGICVEILN